MAAFDFKGVPGVLSPGTHPHLIEIPELPYLAVRGNGDPNAEGGEYKAAVGMLYAVAYDKDEPPLRQRAGGLFRLRRAAAGGPLVDGGRAGHRPNAQGDFHWIALIRLPDFVTRDVFASAVASAERKKGLDLSRVELLRYADGLGAVHAPRLLRRRAGAPEAMERCAAENGCVPDYAGRFHHELYLSDPRRCKPDGSGLSSAYR
ncbi:MAG: transcriptional regulator [Oscillospiraceae bacterium]